MNQHKYDFSQDTRQSKVAIILLIWKYYKLVLRQAWYFLIPLVVSQNKKSFHLIWIGLVVVSVLVFIMAVLSYYRFHFRLENNELIIQKGVFKKSKLNIPFERIQTVNFEQNIILQVLQRFKVEIDTAGSSKKEFSFDALDVDVAKQLRQLILERKNIKSNLVIDEEGEIFHEEKIDDNYFEEEPYEENILALNPGQLLKIGLTENHLKAGIWLIAVVGYLLSTVSEAGFNIEEKISEYSFWQNLNPSIALFFSIIPTLLVFLIGISVVRTFLKYFDLKFNRVDNGFKIFSGLLNRKEYSAPDNKIQKFAYGDSPLRRIFGVFVIWLKQARSTNSDKNKSISIPVVSKDQINKTLSFLYGQEMEKEQYEFPISYHFLVIRLLYFVFLPGIVIITSSYFFPEFYLLYFGIAYIVYFTGSVYVQYKKARYLFNDFFIKRKRGIYGNYYEILPWYKVQVVEVKQSIYQRRKKLATLYLYSAAGEISIPFIPIKQAEKLRDFALYKAESSTKEWM